MLPCESLTTRAGFVVCFASRLLLRVGESEIGGLGRPVLAGHHQMHLLQRYAVNLAP
jgi:hypothetical protein